MPEKPTYEELEQRVRQWATGNRKIGIKYPICLIEVNLPVRHISKNVAGEIGLS